MASTIAVINLDLSFCCRLLLNPKYFSCFGFRVSQWLRRGHGRGASIVWRGPERRDRSPLEEHPTTKRTGEPMLTCSVFSCSCPTAHSRMPHAACSRTMLMHDAMC